MRIDYAKYLQSDYWRVRKILFKQTVPNCCACCQAIDKPLDVNHLRYYRNGRSILYREKDFDLELLCRDCHEKYHQQEDKGKTNYFWIIFFKIIFYLILANLLLRFILFL